MYIKIACGKVVKEKRNEESNSANEKELLAYWTDFLETSYLTQGGC